MLSRSATARRVMTISVTSPLGRLFRSGSGLPNDCAHIVRSGYAAGFSVDPGAADGVQILLAQLLPILPQSHGVAHGLARRRIVSPRHCGPDFGRPRLRGNE